MKMIITNITGNDNRYYPYIWSLEEYSWIDDTRKQKGQGISKSTQNEFYNNGRLKANREINVINTMLVIGMERENFLDGVSCALLKNPTSYIYQHATPDDTYWLASRCTAQWGFEGTDFGIQRLHSGSTGYIPITDTKGQERSNDIGYHCVPIVTMKLSKLKIGKADDSNKIGTGSNTSPFSLELVK